MDAFVREIPIERNPSSERVFGAEALLPSDGPDLVPATLFFASPLVEPVHRELLTAAHERLLHGARDVLDLVAGRESFLPSARSLRVTGLGFGASRLAENPDLATCVVQDLNEHQILPFADASFDAVLCSLDIGLLRRPLEVFREVARVLRPGGVVAISFMHPFFARDLTRCWSLGDDREHVVLAEAFLEFATAGFTRPQTVSLFRTDAGVTWNLEAMPPDQRRDGYIYTVYAYRDAAPAAHEARPPFPPPAIQAAGLPATAVFDADGRPCCPYCQAPLGRYVPPVTPFEIDYGVAELGVCFNDLCEYHRRSRYWMRAQGHAGYSYRFSWNPESGQAGPIPDNLAGGLASCRID
jgi:SAM-dependent methyltransferase